MNEDRPERRQKHLDIYSAVNDIGQLSERVREMASRISGPIPVTEGEPKNPDEPTLCDVLSFSADKIRSHLDNIHKMLEEIEQALF